MLNYANLPMPGKTVLVTLLFLLICTGVCTCLYVRKKQNRNKKLLLLLCTLAISAMMLLYASLIPAERAKPNIPEVALWFADQPLVLPVLTACVIAAFFAVTIREEWIRRRSAITPSSIKESLDHLHTGLCFALPNGLVLLTNHQMNKLSHVLFAKHIQNANLFWQAVCQKASARGHGSSIELSLPDGSRWAFSREPLRSFIQISAVDTTQQHQLIEELQAKNSELEAMSDRIRDYGEQVDDYVIARERLETRVNLHGFLGQALLMTRHHLLTKADNSQRIIDLWQRNIDVLRLEAEPRQENDSFASLQNAAKAIGMQVHLLGSLPTDKQLRRLIASVGAEALTNAVRHAGASQLFIDVHENEASYIIRYTNDGSAPSSPIAEGGGLTTARRKMEAAGGSMRIEHAPRFALILTFEREVNPHG